MKLKLKMTLKLEIKLNLEMKLKLNIRDRQPMIRASVTERWAQLQTGNNILVSLLSRLKK